MIVVPEKMGAEFGMFARDTITKPFCVFVALAGPQEFPEAIVLIAVTVTALSWTDPRSKNGEKRRRTTPPGGIGLTLVMLKIAADVSFIFVEVRESWAQVGQSLLLERIEEPTKVLLNQKETVGFNRTSFIRLL